MEKNSVRIRVNLSSREFEVEGDASYINDRFGGDIDEYLALIKQQKGTQSPSSARAPISATEIPIPNVELGQSDKSATMPDSFGEYFNKFSKSLNIVDKLLVASYFVQNKNSEKAFTLKEAADLLLVQGVKLSNPNAFNKANSDTKRIFKLSGKNFRVSEIGVEYINGLTTA